MSAALVSAALIGLGLVVAVIVLAVLYGKCSERSSGKPAPQLRTKLTAKGVRARENLVALPPTAPPAFSELASEQLIARRRMASALNTAALSAESRRKKI